MARNLFSLVGLSSLLVQSSQAISLDLSNVDSIKQAASTAAQGMVSYYHGNQTGQIPGILGSAGDPYYWWEGGAMFSSLVDYWNYVGDDKYNEITTQALLFQVGPDLNYNPPNQSRNMGIDDQGFWALAAMNAADSRFPNPPAGSPSWLSLAENVWNFQQPLWDTTTCGGGFRWQIFAFNAGYNIKNTISQGTFFQLSARLAAYTGNQTYADWASKVWDWTKNVGLIDDRYYYWDNTETSNGCISAELLAWTYNAGVFLAGAAAMYNHTGGSSDWRERIDGTIDNLGIFLENNVVTEFVCAANEKCNTDQKAFKAIFVKDLVTTMTRAPYTREKLQPILRASASAAANQCTGGDSKTQCNFYWTANSTFAPKFSTGVGEQMAAMQVFQANLLGFETKSPATANTTTTSTSNNTTTNTMNPGSANSSPPGTSMAGSRFGDSIAIVTGNQMTWTVGLAVLSLLCAFMN